MHSHKLSLFAAIVTNVNIMLGAGIFINTVELAKRAHVLGFVAYGVVSILLLPLIYSMAKLVERFPDGGFYTFATKGINLRMGFFSAWSYFTAKLASATLLIHTAVIFLSETFPLIKNFNIWLVDLSVIFSFVALNTYNVRIGTMIQTGIVTIKLIPVLFVVIIGGLFLATPTNAGAIASAFSGIPVSLPLVLFAMLGFEATCSLSNKIENSNKNGPRAIFISYTIVVALLLLYQLIFYLSVGPSLEMVEGGYRGAFPLFLKLLLSPTSVFLPTVQSILYIAVAISALGGAYGILYSNLWNLHVLAVNNHLFFSGVLRQTNKHLIPYFCVLVEGVICVFYLYITKAQQIPLQQISVLGSTISYAISVIALLQDNFHKREKRISFILAGCGLLSCAILLGSCIRSIWLFGTLPLLIMGTFWMIGITIYSMNSKD